MRPEPVDLQQRPPQAWKNGAGTTRELALQPPDAAASDFEWRFSVAEVAGDAPFSAYPGVDRCIVLLDGAGMLLRAAHGTHRLARAFEPYGFSGDEAIAAQLIDGPTTDFNVMVRRGRWRAEVGEPPPAGEAADAGLLLCWHGTLQVELPDRRVALAPQQALLWRDGLPALRCRPATADTRALLVRLQRV